MPVAPGGRGLAGSAGAGMRLWSSGAAVPGHQGAPPVLAVARASSCGDAAGGRARLRSDTGTVPARCGNATALGAVAKLLSMPVWFMACETRPAAAGLGPVPSDYAMTIAKKLKRRLLQVSIKPDLYEQMRAHCDNLDLPMAVWARELIKRELLRQS